MGSLVNYPGAKVPSSYARVNSKTTVSFEEPKAVTGYTRAALAKYTLGQQIDRKP